MAKKQDSQQQQTMEDFLLAQLQEEVILKDGTQLKAAIKREQCQTCLSIAEREQARPKGQGGGRTRDDETGGDCHEPHQLGDEGRHEGGAVHSEHPNASTTSKKEIKYGKRETDSHGGGGY